MSALVSVIVPVYNVEKYLRQCLDSLLEQTYKNIEVVMVDDGSKDSSGKICDEYAKKYENFYAVHKENAGLGMARNTGFEHINGEYVTFLDSDDYLENDCIEILYNTLLKQQVDMCKGGFKRVIDSGEVISKREYQNELFLSLIHISEPTRRTPISYAVFCLKKKKKTYAVFCLNKKKKRRHNRNL